MEEPLDWIYSSQFWQKAYAKVREWEAFRALQSAPEKETLDVDALLRSLFREPCEAALPEEVPGLSQKGKGAK